MLSYAWRVEERDVEVRVWCSTPDLGRLTLAVEDLDDLVDGIRLEPRPVEPVRVVKAPHPESPVR